ncbi:MAG TPA: hypothetical protein VN836_13105 [Verrucomicrobiae bacterium]|nr:hypothetical protein [Verrucomicrobiae bacterium]
MDCGDMLPLSSTRQVASNQSADVLATPKWNGGGSAHSKSTSGVRRGNRRTGRSRKRDV